MERSEARAINDRQRPDSALTELERRAEAIRSDVPSLTTGQAQRQVFDADPALAQRYINEARASSVAAQKAAGVSDSAGTPEERGRRCAQMGTLPTTGDRYCNGKWVGRAPTPKELYEARFLSADDYALLSNPKPRVSGDELGRTLASYHAERTRLKRSVAAPRTNARARGAGRPRAVSRKATRSSAESGDSGSSGEPEPPAGRLCAGCGADLDALHKRPQAKLCGREACKKRVARAAKAAAASGASLSRAHDKRTAASIVRAHDRVDTGLWAALSVEERTAMLGEDLSPAWAALGADADAGLDLVVAVVAA